MLIMCLYVDESIYSGNDMSMIEKFNQCTMSKFDGFDLGITHYFLGIEVVYSTTYIFISEKKYIWEILNRFQLTNCIEKLHFSKCTIESGLNLTKDLRGKKIDNIFFKWIVGCLMYLIATRPDIMYVISLIRIYMKHPQKSYSTEVIKI